MQKSIKIIGGITLLMLLLWILPWAFHFAADTAQQTPFTLYSCLANDFVQIDYSGKKPVCTDRAGNHYTEQQFDSLLPLFNYRQLMADDRLPDTLLTVPLTPKLIQTENFIFRSAPTDVNATSIPLYPLLESMSGRVDLEMPDDVFRIGKRIEFIDMATNSVNEKKSERFTQAMLQKGFVFPASMVAGNPTARKEYDEGYLIVDGNGQLFHLKQMCGRPYVRAIEKPADLAVTHVFVTEFKNRRWLAFLTDAQQHFWVLEAKTYHFRQVDLPAFDPTTTTMSIIGNMFDWTVTLRNAQSERLFAIDAATLRQLGQMERPKPERTVAQKVGRVLLPLQLRFTSYSDEAVFPRFLLLE